MIELEGLTKRYDEKLAVNNLTFTVRPGVVTGFLGPNGAGKSTTMRMVLGLDHPTSGDVRIDGKRYDQIEDPLRYIGALLDAKAVHGGRSAFNHLLCLAQSNGIPAVRVHEVLDTVGLTGVARKKAKGFSLGMGQRLGIAAALLGDPRILMFGRTGQRARPGGHPLDPHPDEVPRGAGQDRVRLQPPHERDGADRGPSCGHRPGPAARGHLHGRLHREELQVVRPCPLPAARTAARRAARGGHHRRRDRRRSTGGGRRQGRTDRRAGRPPPDRAARAQPATGLLGGGVHAADGTVGGVPRALRSPRRHLGAARSGGEWGADWKKGA